MRLSADHKLRNYRSGRLHRTRKIRAHVTRCQLSLGIKSRVGFLDRAISTVARFPQITRARNIEFFLSSSSYLFSLIERSRYAIKYDTLYFTYDDRHVSAHRDIYSQFDKLKCKKIHAPLSHNYTVKKKNKVLRAL